MKRKIETTIGERFGLLFISLGVGVALGAAVAFMFPETVLSLVVSVGFIIIGSLLGIKFG